MNLMKYGKWQHWEKGVKLLYSGMAGKKSYAIT